MKSIKTDLTFVLLLSILLPTTLIGTTASWFVFNSIKENRIEDVEQIADERYQVMRHQLFDYQRHGQDLLKIVLPCRNRDLGVNRCAEKKLEQFININHAVGLFFHSGIEQDLTLGNNPFSYTELSSFLPQQIAMVSKREGRYLFSFVTQDETSGTYLISTYSDQWLKAIFISSPVLGESGEVFLADSQGFFITPPRYPTQQGIHNPITVIAMQQCLDKINLPMLGLDYRNMPVIHGFRFVPEIGGGCIMAHIDQKEAFNPLFNLVILLLNLVFVLTCSAWYIARKISHRMSKSITALTNMTQMLSESQRIAHIGSWSANLATGKIRWSTEMYRLYGIKAESFDHTIPSFFDLIHPNDRVSVRRALKKCLIAQKSSELDFRIVLSDGRIRFMRGTAELHCDKTGKPVGMVGSTQDISERKQAEWLSHQLNAMIDISLDGFWIVDLQGSLLQVNEAYIKMSGYSVDELLNMHISQLSAVKESSELEQHIKNIAMQGYAQFETHHRHKNGHIIDMEVSVAFLPEFQQFCAFFRDITKRKEYEKQIKRLSDSALNKAKLEAEKANLAKSEFLSSMSHELRTPMNAVLGFAQLLATEDLTEDQQDSVQEILTAGHHLMDLINEVLDLSKIESGKLELKLEKVPLAAIIKNCLSLVHPLLLKNNINVINKTDYCHCIVIADSLHLKQVLLNLISNAIKYNSLHGSITLSCLALEKKLRINISDTGKGLSAEQMAKLFQPFERLEAKNSAIQGTGIGLHISKKLMIAMKGKIGVNSVVGEGSCFWIEVPLSTGD